jgi:sortase A
MNSSTRKVLRGALALIIIVGVAAAVWPLGQSAYSQWSQRELREQWNEKAHQEKKAKIVQTVKSRSAASLSRKPKPQNREANWPSTRIVIPDAGTDMVVLDGWDESTLRGGPGHLPQSALPGQAGNCVIAGHRNIYGSPFYQVDRLMPGAAIELRTPDATYTYNVLNVFAATDSDQTVMRPPTEPGAKPLLTLITCTIPRTSNRIIVTAELQEDAAS